MLSSVAVICSRVNPFVSRTLVKMQVYATRLKIPKNTNVQDSPTRSWRGANASATTALDPKFTRVETLRARPRVQRKNLRHHQPGDRAAGDLVATDVEEQGGHGKIRIVLQE